MSTRAMIAFADSGGRCFRVYYRHCDGYPTGLGLELIRALKEARDPGSVARKAGLEYQCMYASDEFHPRIYPECQGDLDWFYVVRLNGPELTSVDIFRTGNPYLNGGMSWRVWGSYLKYLPENLEQEFRFVEISAAGTLQALHQLQKAGGGDRG
ncbi:MAG: hypothetical protein JRI96_04390 [Deltaproteobacteria bacterium]|nr:hypothetical protein [Deltaproteobacteria bacterium]